MSGKRFTLGGPWCTGLPPDPDSAGLELRWRCSAPGLDEVKQHRSSRMKTVKDVRV